MTPISACAPPGDQRKPVTTSSNTTSAPWARAAAAIEATRSGGSGTAPQAAPVGSRITQATSPRASSRSSAPSANGSTTLRWGLGGDPSGGRRSSGNATPGIASSCQPWKWPASLSTRLRPVKPRATRSASSVASVPLEVKRTRSALGTSATMRSAQSDCELAGGAEVLAQRRLPAHGLDDGRMRVAGDHRAVPRDVVEEAVAVEVPLVGALGARDAGRERILPARVVREAAREERQRALVRGLRARVGACVLGQGREGGAHAANATAGPARV